MLCFGIGVGVRVKGYSLYLLHSGDDTSVIRSVVRVSLVVPSHQQVTPTTDLTLLILPIVP
jgi:hypothetical protein